MNSRPLRKYPIVIQNFEISYTTVDCQIIKIGANFDSEERNLGEWRIPV